MCGRRLHQLSLKRALYIETCSVHLLVTIEIVVGKFVAFLQILTDVAKKRVRNAKAQRGESGPVLLA